MHKTASDLAATEPLSYMNPHQQQQSQGSGVEVQSTRGRYTSVRVGNVGRPMTRETSKQQTTPKQHTHSFASQRDLETTTSLRSRYHVNP